MTQNEAVKQTIAKLGGIATIPQIMQHVSDIENCKWRTQTPDASVRRIVRHTPGIFVVRRGLYALEDMKQELQRKGLIESDNADEKERDIFNHSYYQGLLISLGNLKGFDSFVPAQDKNRVFSAGQKLGKMASLKKLPRFSYDELVKKCSTIDTVWMNNRSMPHSFFEVEHTTNIEHSLFKFSKLQDFHTRMFIVADEYRRSQFQDILSSSAFDALRGENRVKFLSYDSLVKIYEYEMKLHAAEFRL